MKKRLVALALSLALLAGCNRNSEQRSSNSAIDSIPPAEVKAEPLRNPPENIADIETAYTKITQDLHEGQLDSSSFAYNCHEERTGRVTYFSRNGQLVVIRHVYGEYSHYEAEEHYYIQGDQLYFIFKRGTTWAFDSGAADGATRDQVVEHRIYVKQQQPIQCLEKKYVLRSAATDNPNSDEVPNKTTNCETATPLLKTFQILRKRQSNPTEDCLQE